MTLFDPLHLTPEASLNRVRIVDLPGIEVDSSVLGKTAYELVSTAALVRLIEHHAADLHLKKKLGWQGLLQAFDACFHDERKPVRGAAKAIARRMGQHLGYILLTLKRGDGANRKARKEWDDGYWNYWAELEQVWLGGGLMSGALGQHMRDYALAVLRSNGFEDFRLDISPSALYLPLVGAARHIPEGCNAALVFDFGGTLMKRACARYTNGQLTGLRIFPPLPTEWDTIVANHPAPFQQANELFNRMIHVMTNTWHDAHAAGVAPAGHVAISISAYVDNGNPFAAQAGHYTTLTNLSDNVQGALALRMGARIGETIQARLLHDGTAAAAAYAGAERAAVITIGTALGIGYPPPAEGLRPLAPDFAILDETRAPYGEA